EERGGWLRVARRLQLEAAVEVPAAFELRGQIVLAEGARAHNAAEQHAAGLAGRALALGALVLRTREVTAGDARQPRAFFMVHPGAVAHNDRAAGLGDRARGVCERAARHDQPGRHRNAPGLAGVLARAQLTNVAAGMQQRLAGGLRAGALVVPV